MMGKRHPSTAPGQASDPESDWAEIWQSEWRALATDREVHETAVTLAFYCAQGLAALAWWLPDAQGGRSGARAQAGPASLVASSDAGNERRRIIDLVERVAELERRLAALQPTGDPPAGR